MAEIYLKHILKNGTRVILVPDKDKQVVTALVLFGVGSRYEKDDLAGISHVLEHMAFKGTKKRPTPQSIAEFVEGMGGENNAFTSKEYTGYYVKVASKYLDKSIDFLSDILINPLFPADELEKEKGVILQELDMYEELPMEVVASKFDETIFGKNSLGRDVIGRKESIKAVSREDLVAYRDLYYRGNDTVVTLAGNFGDLDETEIISMLEKSFSFPAEKAPIYDHISPATGKRYNLVVRNTEQSHIVIGFTGVSYSDPDRYAMKLLALILGGSMGSRMFTEIREKRGLAYAVRSSAASFLDNGYLETYAGVPHSRAIEAIEAILGEYGKANEIREDELVRAKEIIYGKILINMEDANEVANLYASGELLSGEISSPKQIVEKYEKITLADIHRVAEKYLVEDSLTLSFVGRKLDEKKLKEIFSLSSGVTE